MQYCSPARPLAAPYSSCIFETTQNPKDICPSMKYGEILRAAIHALNTSCRQDKSLLKQRSFARKEITQYMTIPESVLLSLLMSSNYNETLLMPSSRFLSSAVYIRNSPEWTQLSQRIYSMMKYGETFKAAIHVPNNSPLEARKSHRIWRRISDLELTQTCVLANDLFTMNFELFHVHYMPEFSTTRIKMHSNQQELNVFVTYNIWASSWDNGIYRIGEQRRLRRDCASAQARHKE